jgi:hypothetical protein
MGRTMLRAALHYYSAAFLLLFSMSIRPYGFNLKQFSHHIRHVHIRTRFLSLS